MVPGPVRCPAPVLRAMAEQPLYPHDPRFVELFCRVLEGMRLVFGAPGGRPVVFNGSGMLAMEAACASLLERGDRVLVVDNGYFGSLIARMARRYTGRVSVIRAKLGERIGVEEVRSRLERGDFRVVALSHVDTGTGVRTQLAELAKAAREQGALTLVDGVSALGGEELKQEEWGVDLYFASTQKALAAPPGLGLFMLGPRALRRLEERRSRVRSIYLDLSRWVLSMESFEDGDPRLVSTPATNLIAALDAALRIIIEEGVERRVRRHRELAEGLRRALTEELGLKLVPRSLDLCANTVTAFYTPEGVEAKALIEETARRGVRIARGLQREIRNRYVRIGHMGDVTARDIDRTVEALRGALASLQTGEGKLAS